VSWVAPAFAATAVRFESESGDYIGGGIDQSFTRESWQVVVKGHSGAAHVSLKGPSFWSLDFAAPQGRPLVVGSYGSATRYPFNSPALPGLNVSGDGRGCNTLTGWFEVVEYQLDSKDHVVKLAINFKQNCEGALPSLYGAVRYHSSVPLQTPRFESVTGVDFDTTSGQRVLLDGSQSFTRGQEPLKYHWRQLSGSAVSIDNWDSAIASFVAPNVAPGGEKLKFKLAVENDAKERDTDRISVFVHDSGDPQTFVDFSGEAGDYITGGRDYHFDPSNSEIRFARNFDGGVSVTIDGDSLWSLDFASPAGTTLSVGDYPDAERFPFQGSTHPGLNVSGDGRGCNMLTGSFTVFTADFDAQGNPKKLDIAFTQHCEGAIPALHGELVLNDVPQGAGQ
jgi:hypothetical protein